MTSLAVDIGAESGRIVAGTLTGSKLEIQEVKRFSNAPVTIDGSLHWDIGGLVRHVQNGISTFGPCNSVGVDTWGVDYVLLDEQGRLVQMPYHYRDKRTEGMMEQVGQLIPPRDIYRETGIQFLSFNTLYQLAATPTEVWDQVSHFMTIPDYLNYQLGIDKPVFCEYTNATTTQCLTADTSQWSTLLLDRLEIPITIFPEVVQPGTKLGKLHFSDAQLIAPACHDTGSAVVAIPSESQKVAWISSGTWSILGVESPIPIINDESFGKNYTNEGGVFGTVRFCKNVMGLWILQECRRTWEVESYTELIAEAESAVSIGSWIDPDDPRFLPPGDMPSRILDFLAETSQTPPASRGEMVLLILESLAMKYNLLVGQLEGLVGHEIAAIHIFGGGSQNSILNQLTANAARRSVIAGPVEATAIGNLLMQMISLGQISNLAEARAIVRNSFPCQTYEPQDQGEWLARLEAFGRLLPN